MKNYSGMFMSIAEITAKESNCVKYKVGAVAVRDNRVILQGYNGTIAGFTNCSTEFSNRDMTNPIHRMHHHDWANSFEVHAEMNVIAYAARKGISLEGATVYCTLAPCDNCLKHLIQAGICQVLYKEEYGAADLYSKDRLELLKMIKIEKYG